MPDGSRATPLRDARSSASLGRQCKPSLPRPFPVRQPVVMSSAVSAAPAIRCRGLHKRYGDTVAVRSLDLEIRRGECFGLLGPNGAGKTTTVEILEGLTPPDAGEVEILGLRWSRDAQALRSRPGSAAALRRLPDEEGTETVRAIAVVPLADVAATPR